MRDKLAQLWHQRAKLTRADIFGSHDATLRPIAVPSQVDICVPGMVGPEYQAGGLVIVSVNPAGGRDGFIPTAGDKALYEAAVAVRRSDEPEHFERLCQAFIRGMPSWGPQWRIINDLLKATGTRLTELAYPYLVPFRSRGDEGSRLPKPVLDAGYLCGFAELLEALEPRLLIAVDRPSESACQEFKRSTGSEARLVYFTRRRDAHSERARVLAELAELRARRSS